MRKLTVFPVLIYFFLFVSIYGNKFLVKGFYFFLFVSIYGNKFLVKGFYFGDLKKVGQILIKYSLFWMYCIFDLAWNKLFSFNGYLE